MATNYWDYIRVEELLALQGGVEGDEAQLENDEVRFIVIHQIDELWMKLALREMQTARDLFKLDPVPETSLASACAALRRVSLTFDLAAQHFKLMETMRTQDYLKFRDKLSPASGFQSAQLREIEILLGLDDADRIAFAKDMSYRDALKARDGASSPALARVERRAADTPTIKDAIYAWLARTPIDGSTPDQPGDDEAVRGFLENFLGRLKAGHDQLIEERVRLQALSDHDRDRLRERYAGELQSAGDYLRATNEEPERRATLCRIRAAILFIESNRELPLLSWPGEIIDALIETEQAMLIFRQRHARMVERVIGRRVGTGGSDGVAYLDQTALSYRVFKEVWAARTMLLDADSTPEVQNRSYYGLRSASGGAERAG